MKKDDELIKKMAIWLARELNPNLKHMSLKINDNLEVINRETSKDSKANIREFQEVQTFRISV